MLLTRKLAGTVRRRPGAVGDDHLDPDDRGSCKGPPPDCLRIVMRLQYGLKARSDRRTTSRGQSALVNAHANRPLTPPSNRQAAVGPMEGRGGARTATGELAVAAAWITRHCQNSPERPVLFRTCEAT
jgi:hypothetical protein